MQKITIKNFRQITTAEIEIKNFLILIGEQASGKSTLAKLIYFFKSLKEDYFNLIYENENRREAKLERLFITQIQEKFKVYFGYTSDLSDDFEVIFFYNYVEQGDPSNRYLKLSKRQSLQIQFDSNYFGEIVKSTSRLARALKDFTQSQIKSKNYLIIERTKTRFIKQLSERINTLFYDNYSSMFFPAGRNITVSYPEQFQTLFFGNLNTKENPPHSVDLLQMKSFILHSKFLNDYFNGGSFDTKINNYSNNFVSYQAFDFFKAHSEYILQGKYKNENGSEHLVYNSEDKKTVPLNLASSGQQESIRIIQDLFYLLYEKQQSFRIIEEPEAHLYPLAQKKLMELIALIANCTNSQIIITTHSPYILSIINNLLMYSFVCQNNPSINTAIKEHFGSQNLNVANNEKINLTTPQVQVYSLNRNAENYCVSIIDEVTGLIGDNYLDSVTEELNRDFNLLYNFNFQN